MITLQPFEVCPFRIECPYNPQDACVGTSATRNNEFHCDLVSPSGMFVENNMFRNKYDETGRMEVLME